MFVTTTMTDASEGEADTIRLECLKTTRPDCAVVRNLTGKHQSSLLIEWLRSMTGSDCTINYSIYK